MYRVTTPTHTYTLPISTDECAEIQITYKQDKTSVVKHYQDGTLPDGMSLEGNTVIVVLSQEETAKFAKGKVEAQVRVLTTGGEAMASQTFKLKINDVLNDEVLG